MKSSQDSGNSKSKPSAKEKKSKELEWAKKRELDRVVLNDGQTEVELLGGRCWVKIPKYYKEAFINQVGIAISE